MCHALSAPWVSADPAGRAHVHSRSQPSNLQAHGTAISLMRLTLPGDFSGLPRQEGAGRMGSPSPPHPAPFLPPFPPVGSPGKGNHNDPCAGTAL